MSSTKKITYILLTISAIVFLPLIGAYIHHGGQFPEGYFAYPMLTFEEKPGFSWLVWGIFAAGGFAFLMLYLFPSLFGFKPQPVPPARAVKKVKLPLWFWIGLI